MSDQVQMIGAVVFLAGVIGVLGKMVVKTINDKHAETIKLMEAENAEDRAERNEAIAELKVQRDSVLAERDLYRKMAMTGAAIADGAAALERERTGLPPIVPMAAVLPESNSPATADQVAAAERATLNARLTAAKLTLGMPVDPPDETPEPSIVTEVRGKLIEAATDVLQAEDRLGGLSADKPEKG